MAARDDQGEEGKPAAADTFTYTPSLAVEAQWEEPDIWVCGRFLLHAFFFMQFSILPFFWHPLISITCACTGALSHAHASELPHARTLLRCTADSRRPYSTYACRRWS